MQVIKNRKLNRLKEYDYAREGMYFVTICVKNREYFLGNIIKGEMRLSKIGQIARKYWQEIPDHFPDAKLDEFIIMPNHIHGIIVIIGNKNLCSLQMSIWQKQWARSVSSVVRGFKIGVTKWCRQNNCEYFIWQKSYYDHIIRNEKSLLKIREYIFNNPFKWEIDRNNLENELPHRKRMGFPVQLPRLVI